LPFREIFPQMGHNPIYHIINRLFKNKYLVLYKILITHQLNNKKVNTKNKLRAHNFRLLLHQWKILGRKLCILDLLLLLPLKLVMKDYLNQGPHLNLQKKMRLKIHDLQYIKMKTRMHGVNLRQNLKWQWLKD